MNLMNFSSQQLLTSPVPNLLLHCEVFLSSATPHFLLLSFWPFGGNVWHKCSWKKKHPLRPKFTAVFYYFLLWENRIKMNGKGRRLKQTSLWKWKLQFCHKLDKLNWWQDGKKRISLSSQEMTSATDTITEVKEKDNLPVHTLQFNCWGKKATRPVRANSANIIKDPAGPTFCTFSIPN